MNTRELGALIEQFAPLRLQEEWDNSGFNVDLHNEDIRRVLLCLDVSEAIIEEAAEKDCQVIISHHPLLFHSIKKVDSAVFPGSCLAKLAKHGISLYCAHTTMDSSPVGINATLAEQFGLTNVEPLIPAAGEDLYKIAVAVPPAHAQRVWDALTGAGAGKLGNYDDCTFSVSGTGTFRALDGASPFIGRQGEVEKVEETSIQVLATSSVLDRAVKAVYEAHPYEMPAVDVFRLKDSRVQNAGLGSVGNLKEPITLKAFAQRCAGALEMSGLRVHGNMDGMVSRCAICGGAGGDLVEDAVRAGADVLVTGEIKHNVYGESSIALLEAGHYDTEKCFVPAMRKALQNQGLEVQYKVGICVSERMNRPYIVM